MKEGCRQGALEWTDRRWPPRAERTFLGKFPSRSVLRSFEVHSESSALTTNLSDAPVKSTCCPGTVNITTTPECARVPTARFPGDPELVGYSLSERRAILDHRFYLSIDFRREASLLEAIRSWESGVGLPWRCEKMRRDRTAQLKEIERHKYYLSMQSGHDIGWDLATIDWVRNHAAAWRDWWEQHWWEEQWWERPSP